MHQNRSIAITSENSPKLPKSSENGPKRLKTKKTAKTAYFCGSLQPLGGGSSGGGRGGVAAAVATAAAAAVAEPQLPPPCYAFKSLLFEIGTGAFHAAIEVSGNLACQMFEPNILCLKPFLKLLKKY